MTQGIIPNHLHADDDKLQVWFDRLFTELEGYNTFPEVVTIVSDALTRYANREAQRTNGEAE